MTSETTKTKRNRLIQLIHIGKSKLSFDNDAYHAFLSGVCGKESCNDLSERELDKVLNAMRGCGFEQTPRRVTPVEKGRANAAQLEYIKGMWAKCARNKSGAALNKMIKRIAHVDNIRFLNVCSAQKVILALRDMMAAAGFNPDTSEKEEP
jgi:phage gp16-like protein